MQAHYGHLVRVLHCATDQNMTEAVEKMGLTAAQGRMMTCIAHRGGTPCARDLEKELSLSHPTVSGLLARLEQKGFVELQTDPNDRRSKQVVISQKGKECHERIHEAIRANESRIVQGFTPEEKALFLSFLQRAIENVHPQDGCRDKEETKA